mmetsp:Transcript_19616/g.30234  ORF Transcript_19616/g.30234 Transcript_19616/m.30234 type:complete len:216 (-) Transcript_19616:370-1017(-)
MSTRFTHLASRQTKQKLVKLLFGHKYSGKGPEAHRKLDGAAYSYSQLRNAYLQRLQEIHPDKYKANANNNRQANSVNNEADYVGFDEQHHRFVKLQDAWDQYEAVIRVLKRAGKAIDEDANFTLFGVGCSFADSPQERELRNEITDQACRGWLSSGALPERTLDDNCRTQPPLPLCDDDLFISSVEEVAPNPPKTKGRRRSLVDDAMRLRKRPFG